MPGQSFSDNPDRTLNQLTNVEIDDLTLATGDVIIYDATDSRWKNAPETAGGNAATVDITESDIDATYYPTFVDSAGTTKKLYCNAGTTPWSVNPNTGEFLLQPTIKVGGSVSNGRVAIGANAGTSSAVDSTAVGHLAGGTGQSSGTVAVGYLSGQTLQGRDSVAVGNNAGNSGQNRSCCAIGLNAGSTGQMDNAVAVGALAGQATQGTASIAIGMSAATLSQPRNQVMLNASGIALNSGTLGGDCFINTLKGFAHGIGVGVVKFDPVTFELSYSTT